MPLARQIDFVFRQLEKELTNATAGTVMIHIRNNAIGKFGLKNNPIEFKNGIMEGIGQGMSPSQVQAFRKLAIEALKFRRDWTHGEIMYDFSVRPNTSSWSASISYESNYNMSNWNYRSPSKPQSMREWSP